MNATLSPTLREVIAEGYAIQLEEIRQYQRDIEEHALRVLAAEKEFPNLNHRGSVPEVLRHVPQIELAKIRNEFERRS